MGFVSLFSLLLHAFENFHLKNLKRILGFIKSLIFTFYSKFSSWLNSPKSRAQSSIFPLWRHLTQGHLEPHGPICISLYWKKQKNNGFVEVFLHFFRQMHLRPWMGYLCLEASQTLTQRDLWGAGTARNSVESSILSWAFLCSWVQSHVCTIMASGWGL